MRMTRAALRAQASHESLAIHEDADATQDLSLNQDDDGRPALKDITEENAIGSDLAVDEFASSNSTWDPKKTTKAVKENLDETHTHNTKDSALAGLTNPSPPPEIGNSTSTNAEELEQGPDARSETTSPPTRTVSDSKSVSVPEEMQAPEIAETATATDKGQVASCKTPKFIPSVHDSITSNMNVDDDSFVDSIKSRSPGKLVPSQPEHENEEGSFIDKSASQPPRPASRIEDSVEAMDALEDALEQFSGELPVLGDLRIESPIKEHSTPTKFGTPAHKASVGPSNLKKSASPARPSPSKSPSKSIEKVPEIPKTSSAHLKKPTPRIAGSQKAPSKLTLKAPIVKQATSRTLVAGARTAQRVSQAAMSFSMSPLKTNANAVKKRVASDTLSTSRPGFVPTKSTKPVTKSAFTLPGEAYSIKMKAQREEKARKEEEEEAARRQFKARPAPSAGGRPSMLPRENKASQARLSRVASGTDKENVAPRPAIASKRPASMLLDVRKVRTEPNSASRRTASVTSKSSSAVSREPKFAANVPRVASLTSKPIVLKEEPAGPVTHKKISGKEVFGRSALELKKQDEEKREKEAAARKARAEAAEKGRQASREWAEKQKARQAAQQAPTVAKQGNAVAA